MGIGPGFPANQANPVNVSNQGMPVGGQTAVPIFLNFSTQSSYTLDFTLSQWQNKINSVQSIFVDNSGGTSPLVINTAITNQTLKIPAGAMAYLPIVAPAPPIFTVSCSAGAASTLIIFLNVPMPIAIWYPATTAPSFDGSGRQLVNDVNTATALAGTPFAIAGSPVALTSYSTTTVAATSTSLMPAASWRKYIAIQAPVTADVWINPIGGTAGIGAADCLKIPAGTFYESSIAAWQGAITYYCATGSLELTAFGG